MKIEIKNRFTGAVVLCGEYESIKDCLQKNRTTNLSRADLYGADLSKANLSGAKNCNKYLITSLLILKDQVGSVRAYKLVKHNGDSPMAQVPINYVIGNSYDVKGDTNEFEQCSYGISLATLDWCLKEWREGYRILIAEFTAEDIAAIPVASDGKFRVHHCKIVGEKDLKEIGWPLEVKK